MNSLRMRAMAVGCLLFVVIPSVYAQAPIVRGTDFRTTKTQPLPKVVSSLNRDLGVVQTSHSSAPNQVAQTSFECASDESCSFDIGGGSIEPDCGVATFYELEDGCGIESCIVEEPGCGVESVISSSGCCVPWCDPCEVGRFWFDADFLYWQRSGMKIPALVTGNPLGTPVGQVGILGAPSTQVLLGNDPLLDDGVSGFRYRGGICLCPGWSFEGEYFHFQEDDANFRFDSSSNLALGRPFINLSTTPNQNDTQLISLPPDVDGFVNVNASSQFHGAAARLRFDVGSRCCGGGPCNGCCPQVTGVRMSLGYRYLDLSERLRISEEIVGAGDEFDIFDDFRTDSEFHGIEFGIDTGFRWSNNCINAFGKFAAGVNQNFVAIDGGTTDLIAGQTSVRDSGILAQSSNIGTSDCNVASMVVELGFNLQRQLTNCMSANVGYSVLYWGNVSRAGQQIDLRVNPDLFPPPLVGAEGIGAQRTHALSDYFAHGFNGGVTLVF